MAHKYELMVALIPSLTEKEVEKELENIKASITKQGEVVHEQIWGKRDLYYKIQGHDKGIYAVFHFTTDKALEMLNRDIQLMSHVMRFIIIRLPKNYEIKPFILIEEDVKKGKRDDKKDKKEVVVSKPVSKTVKAKKPELKAEIIEELIEEVIVPVTAEKPVVEKAESSSKKKKSSFDEKIDEIIENLDNL